MVRATPQPAPDHGTVVMTHDAPTGTAAVAWYGRVASDDPRHAAVSLRRQADACRHALPDDFHIVAWFCDAPAFTNAETRATDGSGADTPGSTQTGPAGTGDTVTGTMRVRRDGGLVELLETARRREAILRITIDAETAPALTQAVNAVLSAATPGHSPETAKPAAGAEAPAAGKAVWDVLSAPGVHKTLNRSSSINDLTAVRRTAAATPLPAGRDAHPRVCWVGLLGCCWVARTPTGAFSWPTVGPWVDVNTDRRRGSRPHPCPIDGSSIHPQRQPNPTHLSARRTRSPCRTAGTGPRCRRPATTGTVRRRRRLTTPRPAGETSATLALAPGLLDRPTRHPRMVSIVGRHAVPETTLDDGHGPRRSRYCPPWWRR